MKNTIPQYHSIMVSAGARGVVWSILGGSGPLDSSSNLGEPINIFCRLTGPDLRIRRVYCIGRMFLKILNTLCRKFSPRGKSGRAHFKNSLNISILALHTSSSIAVYRFDIFKYKQIIHNSNDKYPY